MRQTSFKINFKKLKSSPELVYDLDLAVNPDKITDLAKFIKTYHFDIDQSTESWKNYQILIIEAIKLGNLSGLVVLWDGFYYHDLQPDYETDVYTAAEFGNLQMFQHVLYGYMNYEAVDGVENLKFDKLKALASKNCCIDVLEFIESFACCADANNEIGALSMDFLKDMTDEDDDEDKEMGAAIKRFYACVNNFERTHFKG